MIDPKRSTPPSSGISVSKPDIGVSSISEKSPSTERTEKRATQGNLSLELVHSAVYPTNSPILSRLSTLTIAIFLVSWLRRLERRISDHSDHTHHGLPAKILPLSHKETTNRPTFGISDLADRLFQIWSDELRSIQKDNAETWIAWPTENLMLSCKSLARVSKSTEIQSIVRTESLSKHQIIFISIWGKFQGQNDSSDDTKRLFIFHHTNFLARFSSKWTEKVITISVSQISSNTQFLIAFSVYSLKKSDLIIPPHEQLQAGDSFNPRYILSPIELPFWPDLLALKNQTGLDSNLNATDQSFGYFPHQHKTVLKTGRVVVSWGEQISFSLKVLIGKHWKTKKWMLLNGWWSVFEWEYPFLTKVLFSSFVELGIVKLS
jgi:hypothetical protein